MFESAPAKLRSCGLRYGDVITFKGEPGFFVGLAADGFIYWCRDDTDYAVRMCESDSSFGLSSIKVLYRCNLSSGTNASSKPKKKRTVEEKAQAKSALEQMKEKLKNKERARLVSSRLETFERDEADAREELEAYAWNKHLELISILTTFAICLQSKVPVPYEGLRFVGYDDEKCASFGSPRPANLGESLRSGGSRRPEGDAHDVHSFEENQEDGAASSSDDFDSDSFPDSHSRGSSWDMDGEEEEGGSPSRGNPNNVTAEGPNSPARPAALPAVSSLPSSPEYLDSPVFDREPHDDNGSTTHSPGPAAPAGDDTDHSTTTGKGFTVTNVNAPHPNDPPSAAESPGVTSVPPLSMPHARSTSDMSNVSLRAGTPSMSPGATAPLSLAEKYMGQKKKNAVNNTPRYMQNTQAHSSRARGTPISSSLGVSPQPDDYLSPSVTTGSFRLSNYNSMTADELLAQEADFMKEFNKKRKQKK
ncbi:DnaJ domain protein [Angomonas deanei]|uniref:Uncharacterized protein n=1 Tax=Angomonas deanei TaxID=59799 RepID=A0A7G2CIP5_9TRYP|nr:DnaJ domain protein [Angomonas deanei]CAD2218122.1 hypothetical protein, conserved [Angomonas deanei]|eukprot:EPY19144.1 DnaJ domain protein [Angomonas deanei]